MSLFLIPPSDTVFAYPYMLIAPLVCALAWILVSKRKKRSSVLFPDIRTLRAVRKGLKARLRKPILGGTFSLFVLFLSVAASRPQRIDTLKDEVKGRDLILTLDLSRSMETPDFPSGRSLISRIGAVKSVVKEFVAARPNDRIGIVVFGSSAFVQCPLTTDRDLVISLVDRLQAGIAGDATAIGDGLGLSIKRVRKSPGTSRAIILLTDGANNAGHVNPLTAAEFAKKLGIKIHTIGIGSNQPVSVGGGFFSQQLMRQAEYDEKTLKQIAETTGGVYFNAADVEGLKGVYAEIDKLEKIDQKVPEKRKTEELYPLYALSALAALLAYLWLSRSLFMKIPA